MSDSKKTAKTEAPHAISSGAVQPANKRLTDWIVQLAQNDVRVDRIDVNAMSKDASHVLRPIDFEILLPGREINAPEAIVLANRFVESANNDSTMIGRAGTYLVVATARSVGAAPVSTLLIRGEPTQQLVMTRGVGGMGFGPVEEESDGAVDTMQRLLVGYSKHVTEVVKGERDMYATGILEQTAGWKALVRSQFETNQLLATSLTEAMNQQRQLLADFVSASREREAALSMSAERETAREWQKVKAEMIRDGFTVGKHALKMASNRLLSPDGVNAKPAETQMQGEMSVEREGVIEWLADCGKAGIDSALFGAWDKGPPPRIVKRGIFSPEQFMILARVAKGLASADTLIALLMDSGSPYAVTLEQLQATQSVPGMTQGIQMAALALFDLIGQRRDRLGEEGVRRVLDSMQADTAPAAPAPATPAPAYRPAASDPDAV